MQTTAIREAPNDQGSTIDGDALADHAFNLGASVGEASEAAFLLMVKGKEDWEGDHSVSCSDCRTTYHPSKSLNWHGRARKMATIRRIQGVERG